MYHQQFEEINGAEEMNETEVREPVTDDNEKSQGCMDNECMDKDSSTNDESDLDCCEDDPDWEYDTCESDDDDEVERGTNSIKVKS